MRGVVKEGKGLFGENFVLVNNQGKIIAFIKDYEYKLSQYVNNSIELELELEKELPIFLTANLYRLKKIIK